MVLANTYRRRLYDCALDQYGFVTTRDADDIGVPVVELRKLCARGGLEHVAYGLYRFADVPRANHDQYMEAVLRVGPDAYLTHDAVLAFHDLALVNPRRIRIGTPHRVRPQLPSTIEVVRQHLDANELTTYEGVASAKVSRALLDCVGLVMRDRLMDAVAEATTRGLLHQIEARHVVEQLGAS